MGGFTKIKLKNTTDRHIDMMNYNLKGCNVSGNYRFYSPKMIEIEYELYYVLGKGHFPEHLFPKDKINSLDDFKKYWSTEALGEVFVPEFGALHFDCYFGRTSKRAMRNLGKFIIQFIDKIELVDGSFETFMERGMTRNERSIIMNSHLSKYIYPNSFDLTGKNLN